MLRKRLAQQAGKHEPLVIQKQGSFTGGHDHDRAGHVRSHQAAPAFYQVPANPRKLPIVMWHGAGQFSKTWETAGRARGLVRHCPEVLDEFLVAGGQTDRLASVSVRAARLALVSSLLFLDKIVEGQGVGSGAD